MTINKDDKDYIFWFYKSLIRFLKRFQLYKAI